MSRGFLIIALAACAFSCIEAKDKKFSAGGMEVQIKGKGGKFKVYRKNAGENETNSIEVAMDYLEELDSTGRMAVGKGGKVKHSIDKFDSQEFDFEPLAIVKLGYNGTVKASKTSFTCKVGHKTEGIGKIKLDTFVVDEAGLVGPDDDTLWNVVPGDMKFNIELSDWTWCGDKKAAEPKPECGTEVGKFIDFAIKIKGKNSLPIRKDIEIKGKEGRAGKGKKSDYVMGGGVNLRLTNLVEIDGNITEMPEGYPKVEIKGKHDTIFTFRFPRFKKKAIYDPLLTSGEAAAAAQAQVSQAVGLSVFGTVSILFATLASKFVF